MAGHPLFVKDSGAAKNRSGKSWWRRGKSADRGAESSSLKTCPICGELLEKGQLVKSIVFQGGVKVGNVSEKASHIFGCPFCYPANNKNLRICPVCRQLLPLDGYLVARMFERPDRERKHVHVLGCTACRKR
jgi:C4-type Zn-finger protein